MMRYILAILLFLNALVATQIDDLNAQIKAFDSGLAGNIWVTRYVDYGIYQQLKEQLNSAQEQFNRLKKDDPRALETARRLRGLKEQIGLLSEYERSPFQELLQLKEIEELGKITNPFGLIAGFSYIRKLQSERADGAARLGELESAIGVLTAKEAALSELASIAKDDIAKTVQSELASTKMQLNDFSIALDVAKTTFAVHDKKLNEAINRAQNELTAQIKQSGVILAAILGTLIVGFIFKLAANRYTPARSYMINKFINVINFTIIIFILLFAYIENAGYVVTILGFASAGLAIAMKDIFMSLLGWSVIVVGGSFHVGDRIRVRYQNGDYVGDIIDISLLRMTIYEDITLTTYRTNRRSGRIIFIPNNYIFTELIANYTHSGMKTVWDGIDIVLSFDSNHKKAAHIIKNIARKYSKGYTDIAKKKMSKMRDQYSIKNADVEPRIFTFFEPYGMCVSVWYMTNSYAALALRSTISSEVIEALNSETDIKIAYPTQTLFVGERKGGFSGHLELSGDGDLDSLGER